MLRISIYGSWWPDEQKQILRDLVSFLRTKNFIETDIVEGERRPNVKGLSSINISVHTLEVSDLNYLVFTREGTRLGLTTEFDYVLFNPRMIDTWGKCIIFNQHDGDRDSINDLQRSRLDELNYLRPRIPVVPFQTIDELHDSAYAYAVDCTKAIGHLLRLRLE